MATKTDKLKLYYTEGCGECEAVRNYLRDRDVAFEAVDVSAPETRRELESTAGHAQTPTLLMNGDVLARPQIGELPGFLQRHHLDRRVNL